MKARLKDRLKIIGKVLTARNFAYFQYDRAEFLECAGTTCLKDYYQCISPDPDTDINRFFGRVIASRAEEYVKEGKNEHNLQN